MARGTPATFEPWVSVDDVAAYLGVRKDSIYRWIDRRGLPARKIGKLWKLKLSEVDGWVRIGHSDERADLVRAEHAPAAAGGPQPDVSPTGKLIGKLVLIVDDDETVRESLREYLIDEGYRAATARDGDDALRYLGSGLARPDLILLDLAMPTVDGRSFLAERHANPLLAAIPVIVVTAERLNEVPGAAHVLRKPLDLDRLSEAMVETLDPRER